MGLGCVCIAAGCWRRQDQTLVKKHLMCRSSEDHSHLRYAWITIEYRIFDYYITVNHWIAVSLSIETKIMADITYPQCCPLKSRVAGLTVAWRDSKMEKWNVGVRGSALYRSAFPPARESETTPDFRFPSTHAQRPGWKHAAWMKYYRPVDLTHVPNYLRHDK